MKITFHGAAREVTGSCHLLEHDGLRILFDCGLIQGGKERHERNRAGFDFDPASIDYVLLSHAHIDHSGRLALLRKEGFKGPILATPATVALAHILLPDSARIQEEDARWKIKRLRKRNKDASWVEPLYTEADAAAVLRQFVPVEFDEPYDLKGKAQVRFIPAGHILGAAIVDLTLDVNGESRRIAFSGDLGVPDARLMGKPVPISCPDYLLIESTYGDRNRDDHGDKTEQLYEIIRRTIDRGGKVEGLVPEQSGVEVWIGDIDGELAQGGRYVVESLLDVDASPAVELVPAGLAEVICVLLQRLEDLGGGQ